MNTAKWIYPGTDMGDICPILRRRFSASRSATAQLKITALGIYEVRLNGQPVTDQLFTPGWTNYRARLQVQ